jgi:preprotein translocase subunit SecG
MDFSVLAEMAWWKNFLAIVLIVVCILLIIVILLQKGRGGGLAAAFGGSGGQSAFGSKTGDVFTVITICFTVVFLFLAVILSLTYTSDSYKETPAGFSSDGPPSETSATEGDLSGFSGENAGEPVEGSTVEDATFPQPPPQEGS